MKYFFLVLLFFGLGCDGSINITDANGPVSPKERLDAGSGDEDPDSPNDRDGNGGLPINPDLGVGLISGCGIQEIFAGLEPTCSNCHRSGSTPYFASGTAFYNLLVADPAWVKPGDPDNSALVDLLLGQAKGQYTQMPLGTKNYDQLSKEGRTKSSVNEVRQFIIDLEGCTPEFSPKEVPLPVQRKSAQQIFNTLKSNIGLVDADIQTNGNGREEDYPIWNPDGLIPFSSTAKPFSIGAARRWFALGGASYLKNRKATIGLSPTFGQTMVQVSQAWCRKGVEKANNRTLFRDVDQANLSAASDDNIKKNIKYLMLRFWGHVASTDEVDEMFSAVYSIYLDAEDPKTAWVATCAALVRDPLWLVY